jgi:hypothetical protein
LIISTGEEAPVEQVVRAEVGRPLRIALLYGRDDASRRAVARVTLASGAELGAVMPIDDPRSFVDLAQALRDAAPDVVLVRPGSARDIAALSVLLEALRLGCGSQRPAPRIVALAEPRIAERLRGVASPFPFESFADDVEAIRMLRDRRRGDTEELVLRDELMEDAARGLASSSRADALVVDVAERTTSLVLARADGRIDAAHLFPLGPGAAADRVVARAGIDRVRRWLTWPIDAPALLERVYNRARWAGALPPTRLALLLEMALAREAIAHALRDAEYAGLDVAAMRAAPSILVTGRAALFPRASQSLLVLVDGLEPTGVTTVFREPDAGPAERIALVVSLSLRRQAKLRFVRAGGRTEQRVTRGWFGLIPMSGDVAVTASGAPVRGHGQAGTLGILIDARGRPLALPLRDGERIPLLSRWHVNVGAITEEEN